MIIAQPTIAAGTTRGTIVLCPRLCSELDEQTRARTILTFNPSPFPMETAAISVAHADIRPDSCRIEPTGPAEPADLTDLHRFRSRENTQFCSFKAMQYWRREDVPM